MWSGASSTVAGGIFWFTCANGSPGCFNAMSFALKPGWNVYDLQLQPNLTGNPWAGPVQSLRIIPTSQYSIHVELDWLRLYQPDSGNVTLTVQGGSADEVWWDSDDNPDNNDPSQIASSGAGRLAWYVSDGGNVTFPASKFPPGTYRFYTIQNGQVSAYSNPFTVNSRPQPVILDPDITGGDDYATVTRGDPWDFSQWSDIRGVTNATATLENGLLRGSYAGPYPNDPQVDLSQPGAINAALYHHLTYRIYYDGPFSLEDAPGGGMVARVIWTINQGGVPGYHDSQDIVVVPGWQTISVDLKTDPQSRAEDESSGNPIGWGGPASGWVSSLRFDPHEDPGGRIWYLDYIRLARNDRGTPDFGIKFQDNAWVNGTTAELWVDNDSSGFNGVRVADSINVSQGVNTYNWNGYGIPYAGSWWIYVVLHHPDGSTVKSYSTGPVDMVPPAVNPFGSLNGVSAAPGGKINVGGWAIDPDATGPIDVHVYVNGAFKGALTANSSRTDIGAAFPGYGADHGFSGLEIGRASCRERV